MRFEIKPLSQEDCTDSFLLATKVFSKASTLHSALGIGLEEYRDYLRPSFDAMIDEGLSLVARDNDNGTLLGCLIATDFYTQLDNNILPTHRMAPFFALSKTLIEACSNLTDIEKGQALLVDMAAVSQNAQGHGVYIALRNKIEETAKSKGYKFIYGELSSAATQHVILNKLGHKKISEVDFTEFTFNGRKPFQSIRTPKTLVLTKGRL